MDQPSYITLSRTIRQKIAYGAALDIYNLTGKYISYPEFNNLISMRNEKVRQYIDELINRYS